MHRTVYLCLCVVCVCVCVCACVCVCVCVLMCVCVFSRKLAFVCACRLAAKGTSLSPCHLILATPFPQHYKGASRKQALLVQMKDRAWENDRQNIQSEFQ